MTDKMDRGLDDIIADSRSSGPRNRRGRADGRRQDYPRDGWILLPPRGRTRQSSNMNMTLLRALIA
ncbi:hypothetical protein L249_4218 [Ophiocordyceps polyrhachis-furcata BCC 54312]|uniref:Uncharacterized protein n=1 Tax=Ophiocordyceps polyrhachis-furcata BCC 54312 TaxID=1330021 RepID=A0A367LBR4_9HYPO|nr:hypothetical protein L249_4218 [Ophiocordyceps polyrhachis-furcata BCC 54312]